MITGVVIAAALTLVAVPIRIYLCGGVTGSGADLFLAYFASVGQTLVSSLAFTVFGADVADKVLSALLVWGIVRQLQERLTSGYS